MQPVTTGSFPVVQFNSNQKPFVEDFNVPIADLAPAEVCARKPISAYERKLLRFTSPCDAGQVNVHHLMVQVLIVLHC